MNVKKTELIAVLIVGVIVAICWISGILPATINAIRYEFTRPKPPPAIEQQTAGGALADANGDTAAKLTGYEMIFPPGTIDWRVTYSSRCINCNSQAAYTAIDPTYWCKMPDGRWLSCQPVIRETAP